MESEYFLIRSFNMQPSEILSMPSIDTQFLVMKETQNMKQKEEERRLRESQSGNNLIQPRAK